MLFFSLRLACQGAREEWDSVATVETVLRNSLEPRHLVMPHITVHQALAFFQAHDLSVQLVSLMLQKFELGKQLIIICYGYLLFQTGLKGKSIRHFITTTNFLLLSFIYFLPT
jgi:hypothetical protein